MIKGNITKLKFSIFVYRFYSCVVQNLINPHRNSIITSFHCNDYSICSGSHINNVVIRNQTSLFIPNGIGKFFYTLKRFEVMSSKLSWVDRANFRNMLQLEDLRLDNNDIQEISYDTFWDLVSLKWLSLSNNQLQTLSPTLTMRMPNLEWFTANHNQIETFDEKLFVKNLRLELISMHNNRLQWICLDFNHFKRITFIDFRENICVDRIISRAESPNNESSWLKSMFDDIRANCTSNYLL